MTYSNNLTNILRKAKAVSPKSLKKSPLPVAPLGGVPREAVHRAEERPVTGQKCIHHHQ